MRIRETVERIGAIIRTLQAIREESVRMSTGHQGHQLSGLSAATEALHAVSELPVGPEATKMVNSVLQHPVIAAGRDTAHAGTDEWQDFVGRRERLVSALNSAYSVLSALVPPVPLGLFVVQLPEQRSGLDALADDIKTLSEILEQPLRRTLKEEIRVEGVDRGSILLEVVVATKEAAALLVAMYGAFVAFKKLYGDLQRDEEATRTAVTRAQAEARKHAAEARVAEAEARGADAHAARLEHLAELHKLRLEQMLDDAARDIVKPSREDPRIKVRVQDDAEHAVKNAIRKGAEFIDRGFKMTRAIGAGSRAQQLPSLADPPAARQLDAGSPESPGEPEKT